MTSFQLGIALTERGLSSQGTKNDKLQRLEASLIKEGFQQSPQKHPTTEIPPLNVADLTTERSSFFNISETTEFGQETRKVTKCYKKKR